VAAAIGLLAFALVERRVPAPMVDFAFFRSLTFLGANLVAFIVSFAMFAMFFFLALYMQNILGYSPIQAGVRFLPATLMVMFTAPVAGRLADRVGSRRLMAAGLVLVAVALALTTRIGEGTGYDRLFPAFVLMGIGLGLTMSPMSRAAMNSVSVNKAGVGAGILSMNRMVGATFGVAALGALFQHELGSAAQVGRAGGGAFIHALSTGMWLASGVALVGALVALVLVERPAVRRRAARSRRRRRLRAGSAPPPHPRARPRSLPRSRDRDPSRHRSAPDRRG
jgi:predicted MFS family arabinose efflux permease